MGQFAKVECTQEFKNDAAKPVEAVYVFPMPDDASVTECEMAIGKKKVVAELKKRKEAREEYEKALEEGHHASLLEQERPNIFTMNVGGIEPKEEISVKVVYVQRVPWSVDGARFRIPLVVAPRFIPGVPIGRDGGGWAKDTDQVPDASKITPVVAKEGVSYDADIAVSFSPGFRCKLECPSHEIIIPEQIVAKGDTIKLKTGNIRTDRDFTLEYESLSKVPEIAVHIGKLGNENFLLASVIPPGNVAPVASDIVFVLDCSGSMQGAKIAGLRVIAKKIVENLKRQNVQNIEHRVGIQPFDSQPWTCHPVSDINEATNSFIDRLEARGTTELGPALMAAERMFAASNKPRVMLMVTDGQTESGVKWDGKGIRLIGIGIDSAVNDTSIKELTRRNNGVAEFVMPGEDFSAVSNRLAGYASGPVLREVSVKAEGDVAGVSDVFQGWPATISARFINKPCKLNITGKNPEGKEVSWNIDEKSADKCDFAAQIWARGFIRENPYEKKQTDISLKYGVVCAYTSFVAISEKKVPGQKPERVEIPVNLPAGWVYESVFGKGLALHSRRMTLGGALAFRSSGIATVDSLCCVGEISRGPTKLADLSSSGVKLPPKVATFIKKDHEVIHDAFTTDRMISILIAADKGNNEEAAKEFGELCKSRLTLKVAKVLNETTKAKVYYFALRLVGYGYKIEREVMKYLSQRPGPKFIEALAWYYLAMREEGRTTPATSTISVPAGCNGEEYIMWKLGRGARPDDARWSDVP